jgi:hypothetical protein
MGTMVCSACGRVGIYWAGLSGPSPWTFCPNCKEARDPMPEDPGETGEEIAEPEDDEGTGASE